MSLKKSSLLRPQKTDNQSKGHPPVKHKRNPNFKHYPAAKEAMPKTIIEDDRRNWPEDSESQRGCQSHKCPDCGNYFVGSPSRVWCRQCDGKKLRWVGVWLLVGSTAVSVGVLIWLAKLFWNK